MSARIAVDDGKVVTVDVLTWDEDWEFDNPVCILRPVVRYSPNGDDPYRMVEELAEDLAFHGSVDSEADDDGMIDRQFPLKSLKRRWGANRGGKQFPRRRYTASRFRVFFYANDAGELEFDIAEVPAALPSRDRERGDDA